MKLGNLNAEILSVRHALAAPSTPAEDAQQALRESEIARDHDAAQALSAAPEPSRPELPRDR
jgi:hypothetical protein